MQLDDYTPLWVRIGEFLGGTAWFFGMVLLFVGGIALMRAGKHPATKGLKLSGFALLAWVVLTFLGAPIHKALAHPTLMNELPYTAHQAMTLFVSLVGGVLDLALFGLVCMGAVKAGRGVRELIAQGEARARAFQASKGKAVGTSAQPAPAQPVAARPARPAPAPRPAAAPPARAVTEEPANTLETTPLRDAVDTAEDRPKAAAAHPEVEASISAGGFAKPQKVFTVKHGVEPSFVSREGAGSDDLDDTREVSLGGLPLVADEDEAAHDATLVEFPAVPPRAVAR